MRLKKVKGAAEKIASHQDIAFIESTHPNKKWNEVFGNDNPIHIEIGMGKGSFVLGMAKANPDINFIGIEMYDSVLVKALERVLDESEAVPNLRLFQADAARIEDYFDKASVQRIYLNFSDPWHKTRHAKRRLTHENFLKRYETILVADGSIHQKTDNQALFEFSLASIANHGLYLDNISLDLHNSNFEGNVMTEYEQKFSSKGFRIYRLEANRKPKPPKIKIETE